LKKTQKNPETLPFRIDHTSRTDVFDQLVGALRNAIQTGFYKAGDILPTMQELAEFTGVSFGTSRRVIERLTSEGYINPRPRIGSVVMPAKASLWKGHILFVYPDAAAACWYVQTFSNALRRKFADLGYLYSAVPAPWKRNGDYSQFETILGMPFDLALVMYDSPGVVARLDKAQLPYVGISWTGPSEKGQARIIRHDNHKAAEAFFAHCRSAGIKTILEAGFDTPSASWYTNGGSASGMKVRRMKVKRAPDDQGVDSLELGAVWAFQNLRRDRFPDLFLFDDDILAQGALTALLSRGVRIPEDVKVVTSANRGAGPVFVKPLTRFEVDPKKNGELVAQYVVDVLTSRYEPKIIVFSADYVIGETFPR